MPRKHAKNFEIVAKSSRKKNANKNQKKSNETKVLVVYYNDGLDKQRLVTFEGSLLYSHIPRILKAIFSTDEILLDHLGYKLVNDDTEQGIQGFEDDELKKTDGIQYVIEVQCPTVKLQESNNFSKLFNSKKFSDIILSVKDSHLCAQKYFSKQKFYL